MTNCISMAVGNGSTSSPQVEPQPVLLALIRLLEDERSVVEG